MYGKRGVQTARLLLEPGGTGSKLSYRSHHARRWGYHETKPAHLTLACVPLPPAKIGKRSRVGAQLWVTCSGWVPQYGVSDRRPGAPTGKHRLQTIGVGSVFSEKQNRHQLSAANHDIPLTPPMIASDERGTLSGRGSHRRESVIDPDQ